MSGMIVGDGLAPILTDDLNNLKTGTTQKNGGQNEERAKEAPTNKRLGQIGQSRRLQTKSTTDPGNISSSKGVLPRYQQNGQKNTSS